MTFIFRNVLNYLFNRYFSVVHNISFRVSIGYFEDVWSEQILLKYKIQFICLLKSLKSRKAACLELLDETD